MPPLNTLPSLQPHWNQAPEVERDQRALAEQMIRCSGRPDPLAPSMAKRVRAFARRHAIAILVLLALLAVLLPLNVWPL